MHQAGGYCILSYLTAGTVQGPSLVYADDDGDDDDDDAEADADNAGRHSTTTRATYRQLLIL